MSVHDASVYVEVVSDAEGTATWTSVEGWNRHSYSVVGSLDGAGGVPVPMELDPLTPGIFRCRVEVAGVFNYDFEAYVWLFQIAVDDDLDNVFFPALHLARSGEMVVQEPGTP